MRTAAGKLNCEKALIFSQSNSESAGFGVNGNSITIFHPHDAGSMTFVDEDSFGSGRFWQLTSTGSIRTLSDIRLKRNIVPFKTQNILEKIKTVNGLV